MKVVAFLSVSLATAFAFVPAGISGQTTRKSELLAQSKACDSSVPKFFGILSIATVLSFTTPDAFAVDVANHARTDATLASSTVQVADSIKTLDMSLPSYTDLKEYKASVENVKGLAVDEPTALASTMRSRKKVQPKSDSDDASAALSTILPSMGKKSADATKAAASAPIAQPKPSTKIPDYVF